MNKSETIVVKEGEVTMTFNGDVGRVISVPHENRTEKCPTNATDQPKKDTHVNMIFNGRVGTVIGNFPR